MSTAASRSATILAAIVLSMPLVFGAFPSTAQIHGYQPGRAGDFYGYYLSFDRSHRAQIDRLGDYRCDAYWDRGRTDCDAGWRDQRAAGQRGGGRRQIASYGGPAVYYGEYGRPDVVYYSSGHRDRYGRDIGQHSRAGRDPGRIDWCLAEYRSFDPATGYYIAYSGRPVFCG